MVKIGAIALFILTPTRQLSARHSIQKFYLWVVFLFRFQEKNCAEKFYWDSTETIDFL